MYFRDGVSPVPVVISQVLLWARGRFVSQQGLHHLTCGRVAQATRTIMPLARGSAPTTRDPPETR